MSIGAEYSLQKSRSIRQSDFTYLMSRSVFDEPVRNIHHARDSLLICEFCEKKGPRTVMQRCDSTEYLALHLLSVQLKHGDLLVAIEPHNALYVISLHSYLLDLSSRGLMRPYCVAFISHNPKRLLKSYFPVMACLNNLVELLSNKNRSIFRKDAVYLQLRSFEPLSLYKRFQNVDPGFPLIQGISQDDLRQYKSTKPRKRQFSLNEGKMHHLIRHSFEELSGFHKEDVNTLFFNKEDNNNSPVILKFCRAHPGIVASILHSIFKGLTLIVIGNNCDLLTFISKVSKLPVFNLTDSSVLNLSQISKNKIIQMETEQDIGDLSCLLPYTAVLDYKKGYFFGPSYTDGYFRRLISSASKIPSDSSYIYFVESQIMELLEWAYVFSFQQCSLRELPPKFSVIDRQVIEYQAELFRLKRIGNSPHSFFQVFPSPYLKVEIYKSRKI